jgi:hypothetical protein
VSARIWTMTAPPQYLFEASSYYSTQREQNTRLFISLYRDRGLSSDALISTGLIYSYLLEQLFSPVYIAQ